MQALVSLATNASFDFSYTNFAKLRLLTCKRYQLIVTNFCVDNVG